jgi:ribosomal protein S28E/S33
MRSKRTGHAAKTRQRMVDVLPTEKSNCIGAEMGGMASYTDLVSCLEMARDARQLNQGK